MPEFKETKRSLTRQLIQLVEKYCPDLEQSKTSSSSSEGQQFYICFEVGFKPSGFMHVDLRKLAGAPPLPLCVGPTNLFQDGEWVDLEITVSDETYLEKATQIALEYEQLSGKAATLYKDY